MLPTPISYAGRSRLLRLLPAHAGAHPAGFLGNSRENLVETLGLPRAGTMLLPSPPNSCAARRIVGMARRDFHRCAAGYLVLSGTEAP